MLFRSLSISRLSNTNWIVFAAPGQDIDNLADLLVTTEYRIDLPLGSPSGKIHAKAIQSPSGTWNSRHSGGWCGCALFEPGCSIMLDGSFGHGPEVLHQGLPTNGFHKVHIPPGGKKGRFSQKRQQNGAGADFPFGKVN